jgi:ATP-dependent Clp protease ATP-binding subunit ClpC
MVGVIQSLLDQVLNGGRMFERFTDRARRVLVLAQEEARLLNHNFIGTEHILLGLLCEGDGVAARALATLGISLEAAQEKVAEIVGPVAASSMTGSPPFTPRAKKVLELSLREALQMGHNYIGTEHMLLGLIREGEGVAVQVMVSLNAEPSRVRQEVIRSLSGGVETGTGESASGELSVQTQPKCPRCLRPLADNIGTKVLTVPPPEDEPNAEPRQVAFLYCLRCGITLGKLT